MNKRRRYKAKAKRRDRRYARMVLFGDPLTATRALVMRLARELGAHREARLMAALLTLHADA